MAHAYQAANFVAKQQGFTGQGPLEIYYNSATLNGFLDPILKIGSNCRESAANSVWQLALEGDYYDNTDHLHEAYFEYRSADKTTITNFRPLYIAVQKNDNSTKAAQVYIDIGEEAHPDSQFTVMSGATEILTISKDAIYFEKALEQAAAPKNSMSRYTFPISGTGSYASPAGALALYIAAISIEAPVTLTGILISNGSAVSGNLTAALYSHDGQTLLASSASIAQSGTWTSQALPFSTPYVAAQEMYHIALLVQNAAAELGTAWGLGRVKAQTQGSYALPATITSPAASACAWVPIMVTY